MMKKIGLSFLLNLKADNAKIIQLDTECRTGSTVVVPLVVAAKL
jgi:hypothetical protein